MIYYSDTAANGLYGWSAYTSAAPGGGSPLVDGVSQGPYWVDPNHAPPGAGYLNIVAVAYRATAPAPCCLPDISLRGKKIVFDMTIEGIDLPANALLGVWVQAADVRAKNGQGRMMNIFQTKNAICEQLLLQRPYKRGGQSTGWTPPHRRVVEVPFTEAPRDWISLGTSDARADLYGHVEDASVYGEILDNWIDLGIISLLGSFPSPGLLGKFTFNKIEIVDV